MGSDSTLAQLLHTHTHTHVDFHKGYKHSETAQQVAKDFPFSLQTDPLWTLYRHFLRTLSTDRHSLQTDSLYSQTSHTTTICFPAECCGND
uniref:Uncharacterized protein n=1 Tax=Anguilla anguilla TaxID=7936 RepID=A0A0E9WYZ9_ANGAN